LTVIERSVVIEAPVEKVFAFLIDVENTMKINLPEREVEILSRDEGPVKVGSRAKFRHKAFGRKWVIEEEVTEILENERISMRQEGYGGLKKLEYTRLFEPTERGTKLTMIFDYELRGSLLGKIVDRLSVHKDMEKYVDYYAKKAKELLEKE